MMDGEFICESAGKALGLVICGLALKKSTDPPAFAHIIERFRPEPKTPCSEVLTFVNEYPVPRTSAIPRRSQSFDRCQRVGWNIVGITFAPAPVRPLAK